MKVPVVPPQQVGRLWRHVEQLLHVRWDALPFELFALFPTGRQAQFTQKCAMKVNLGDELLHQVFWITECIALGRFATEGRCELLAKQGVTHILNVSDVASVVSPLTHNFLEVNNQPLLDTSRISDKKAICILDVLHAMLRDDNSRAYVHCTAGQLRSPTIVWLYLLACGMDPHEAGTMIGERAPDAAPGHSRLVDEALVVRVAQHGKDNYLPLERSEILTPVEL